MLSESLCDDFKRLSINELARREGVHPATPWRWILTGIRGHKLRAVRVVGAGVW